MADLRSTPIPALLADAAQAYRESRTGQRTAVEIAEEQARASLGLADPEALFEVRLKVVKWAWKLWNDDFPAKRPMSYWIGVVEGYLVHGETPVVVEPAAPALQDGPP